MYDSLLEPQQKYLITKILKNCGQFLAVSSNTSSTQ